ncbi:zinc finger protein 765-like isoform X1 [Artemia franciscana]|uniref:zinc finger protein 765-like isoform X1 n=2 Tax=Artemia franciscana TaxID=6661 RepID=UPI0032DA7896
METPGFGITAIKKELEDALPDDDKSLFGSTDPFLLPKQEVFPENGFSMHASAKPEPDCHLLKQEPNINMEGMSADCIPDSDHLNMESNIGRDKVLPIATLHDKDISKHGCGTPVLTRIRLKKEMNLSCQHEMSSNINVSTKNDLAKHEDFHAGIKNFKCDVCEKTFHQKSNLSCHQRTHTGENPFKCHICEKTFRQKTHLSTHQRTHSGEKPFKCDICDKTFSQKSTLSHHERTHTGDKPFKCVICEKTFSQKSSLSFHHRTHTGENPFECDICEKTFRQKPHLSNHLRTHTLEKPFKCDRCKRCFTTSSSLSRHQRTHIS